MQVFWVSGPVGHIRSVNLSFKTVVLGVVALALGLLATGSLLQFLGFRLALEYDPQIARRLGNLHTAVEVENLNAVYHARLSELETEHRTMAERIASLQAAKRKLADKLPPVAAMHLPGSTAQGGAYLPHAAAQDATPGQAGGSVLQRVDLLMKARRADNEWLRREVERWEAALHTIDGLPLALPVPRDRLSISSGFGLRKDPLTQRPAMHSGLDFELPLGTPVLAAGSGTVAEAGWDAQYGHRILLKHRGGYASRYAHASELLVRQGEAVTVGQVIARSGNSGRSTGPHLHFEIIEGARPVDPATHLAQLAARRSGLPHPH